MFAPASASPQAEGGCRHLDRVHVHAVVGLRHEFDGLASPQPGERFADANDTQLIRSCHRYAMALFRVSRRAPLGRFEMMDRYHRGHRGLQRVAVCTIVLVAICAALAPEASADPPRPPVDQQAEIVDTFTNNLGSPVFYRRGYYGGGSRGFGYEKTTKKHGITSNSVVGAVVRSPQSVRQEDDGYWVHEKQAVLYGLFTEAQVVTIRVVINYSSWEGPGQHGVVTAYCVGYLVCPEWVNTAFPID